MAMEENMGSEEEIIDRLIREELESADKNFHESALKERLLTAVAPSAAKADKSFVWYLRPAYVIGLLLLVMIAILLFRKPFFSPNQALGQSRYITQYLMSSPTTQSISEGQSQVLHYSSPGQRPGGFGSTYERIFESVVPPAEPENEKGNIVQPETNYTPLGLKETIRILFFDRTLEKWLLEYSKKYQEV
jgi:hypothetical protein